MRLTNVRHLGVKEVRSLLRDPMMVALILYAFSLAIYSSATALPETLHKAPIAIIDEDHSPLSERITDAFYPPFFLEPQLITAAEMDRRMDEGRDTFALTIPADFQRDALAGRQPTIQLNVDATRMSQAFTGSGYINTIIYGQVQSFLQGYRSDSNSTVDLVVRSRFNPELNQTWFGALNEIINQVTLLSLILTGAALIREREHGTVEHLLAMPVTPAEIMISKVWSMGLIVIIGVALSLVLVVEGALSVPVQGSILLFLCGTALQLFATTSMGIFLGTIARSMPQFGLLLILVLIPLQILSGGMTPRESMPGGIQLVMLAAPNTHYVILSQAILFRGAGFSVVWPQFIALGVIGSLLFGYSMARFRKTLGTMA